MNYELAKQLEKAGFPQGMGKGCMCYDEKTKEIIIDCTEGNQVITDCVKIPTLEELINACGNEFAELSKGNAKIDAPWTASGFPIKTGFCGQGKTPTESVIKLWLKLQKKRVNIRSMPSGNIVL